VQNNHTTRLTEEANMSATPTTDVGIKPSHNPKTDEFGKPSPAEYNKAHGRTESAPTKGGPGRGTSRSPKGRAPGAKNVSVEYLG
jgi:hypothetical protein